MTQPAHIEAAIDRAYRIEAMLHVASQAVFQDTGKLSSGLSMMIDLAADMAGEIVQGLEMAEKARKNSPEAGERSADIQVRG